MVKERPILFKGEMVRAILAGRKTQTRRIIKPQPEFTNSSTPGMEDCWYYAWKGRHGDAEELHKRCPYGQPGDRLWVRETWGITGHYKDGPRYEYRAHPADGKDFRSVSRWRPSIHMPRCASRILLEITHVDVEQVRDISEEDAEAEGVRAISWYDLESIPESEISKNTIPRQDHLSYRAGFYKIWESINGPDSWGANPWVWVVKFKIKEVTK